MKVRLVFGIIVTVAFSLVGYCCYCSAVAAPAASLVQDSLCVRVFFFTAQDNPVKWHKKGHTRIRWPTATLCSQQKKKRERR